MGKSLTERRKELLRPVAVTGVPSVPGLQGGYQAPKPKPARFSLREDDPSPEPVAGPELLADVQVLLSRYMILPDGAALTVAAWATSTYLMDAFEAHPLLAVTSPEKKCGKTRLLEVLEVLCSRPYRVAGISEAALFRLIGTVHPTLLIDEAQILRQRDERSAALHDLLCASNRRGSFVLRCGGKDRDQLEQFAVFGPKALAAIGVFADVIMDRAIEVRLRRRAVGEEHVQPFYYGEVEPEAMVLRQRLRRWAADHEAEVAEVYRGGAPPSFLEDREAENWLPLFAVVFVLDSTMIPQLETAARFLTTGKTEVGMPSAGVRLLSDIRAVLDGRAAITTPELLKGLHALEEAQWADWRGGRALTAEGLAKLLRPYNIHSQQFRLEGVKVRGFDRQSFEEAWRRYIPSVHPVHPVHPVQPNGDAGESVTG